MVEWPEEEVAVLRARISAWFRANARDLPWRRTRDPYRIWISEVMLQQTRVATAVDRYTQFVRRFPTLVSLALAGEDEVLAQWSGLGYYKRARLLHESARLLIREHGGVLPKSSVELRRLPGVGDYTAAAIASIAFGEPVAVVDGNVERVLIRLLGVGGPDGSWPASRIRKAAGRLLDSVRPGVFNQAMMELGATICLPQRPLCFSCPIEEFCGTKGEHPRRPREQMASRRAHHALIRRSAQAGRGRVEVWLVRRPEDAGQMPGMWELPAFAGRNGEDREPILRIRHSITNTNYYVEVFAMNSSECGPSAFQANGKWVAEEDLREVALTGLARKILMRLDVLARPRRVRLKRNLPGVEEGLG